MLGATKHLIRNFVFSATLYPGMKALRKAAGEFEVLLRLELPALLTLAFLVFLVLGTGLLVPRPELVAVYLRYWAVSLDDEERVCRASGSVARGPLSGR